MEMTTEMKNVKVPTYAVKLGKGLFAGVTWQCEKCGKIQNCYTNPGLGGGRCPETASGNHIWRQI